MSAAVEARLRQALAGSSEQHRPLVDLEWPWLVQKALKPLFNNLREAAVLVPILRRPATPCCSPCAPRPCVTTGGR